MNTQSTMQPKPAANGFGRRRVDRDAATRSENKMQSGKSNSGRVSNTGAVSDGKVGGGESVSSDRLLYLTTCLIGHPVEVQVKNGSVYAGIFHATDAERDFGIVLKSARMVKDGTLRGQKASEFVSKPPSKILIVPAKELAQVIAKDVAVTSDAYTNELRSEKLKELMTDSNISQSRHVEAERELAPWVPDEDDPECPELENIFEKKWDRSWDQFEVNKLLFGVKSTFNEELYTTKLEKGPQMRDLEREAMRIAREIEGEETRDLHVAEERGLQLNEKYDVDEETRYSSVYRGRSFDDSGYEEDEEDILLDSRNIEAFRSSSASVSKRPDSTGAKSNDGGEALLSSSKDSTPALHSNTIVDKNHSVAHDCAMLPASHLSSKDCPPCDSESRIGGNLPVDVGNDDTRASVGAQASIGGILASNLGGSQLLNSKPSSSDKGAEAANLTAADSSCISSKTEPKGGQVSGKALGETQSASSSGRPSTSISGASEHAAGGSAASGSRLSPSSSVGSLSSEKSTLNPNAKEFKLNPNAKSFTPSHSAVRPPSPVSDGSFYYPGGVSPVPPMHGMSVGFGMGPSFPSHQPVMYSPQLAPMQAPQTYFHPNGHQYGQQMLLGQPRQVVYMPTYQPEMPYKG